MKTIPAETTGNIKQGLWLVYKDGNNVIKAWGSCTNGKEEVYLNDVLISENRNLNARAEHVFEYEGNEYKVKFTITQVIKGQLECRFYKNNVCVKAYRSAMKLGQMLNWKNMSLVLLAALIFGLSAVFFKFPEEYYLVFAALVGIVYVFAIGRKPILIEEVSIE